MKKIIIIISITLCFNNNFKAQVLIATKLLSSAQIYSGSGLTIDASNDVYFTSNGTDILKRSITGAITTILPAGLGFTDINYCMAVDGVGNVYFAETKNSGRILKVSQTGSVTTLFTNFYYPAGVAVDGSGNVYVAGSGNQGIYKITPTGTLTTIGGGGGFGYVDGAAASSRFYYPSDVVVDVLGNVYVADQGNNCIRKITPAGIVSTIAGSTTSGNANGIGTAAQFNSPVSIDIDATGNFYIADNQNGRLRKIDATTNAVTTLQAFYQGALTTQFSQPHGIAINSVGDIFISNYDGIHKFSLGSCYVQTNTTLSVASLSANIKGLINAIGNTTNSSFEYGITTVYGNSITATPGFVVGNTNTAISATLTGLTPNTTYHYRAVGTNSAGIQYGMDSTFHTLGVSAPSATTTNATNVLGNTATVYGTINANGDNTTIIFEYDTSPAYGFSVAAMPNTATGNSVATYSANLSGLTINTQYLYRIKATNSIGTTFGGDMTFTTNSTVTAISENQNNNSLNIYPNPANSVININGLGKQKQIISITNILGKCVKTIEANNTDELSIDLKELNAGMYFINCNNLSYKLIKD